MRITEPTQILRRLAVSSMLIVSTVALVGSCAAIPRRSRSSRTRTVVQLFPSEDLQRIRFIVTARSLSGH